LFGYFPWKRNNLPQLNISPDNIQIEIKDGESILTACLRNNISHLHTSGGMDRCSTCRIAVSEGIENCTPANKTEQILAKKIDLPPEFRLACQTEVTGDVHFRRLLLDKWDLVIASQQGTRDTSFDFRLSL
jgi:adenylate cyclase